MKTFYHSGRIGDIIYSLPTIKRLGGGRLVTGLPLAAHDALAPLLATQPYITGIGRIEIEGLPQGFFNLDLFRHAPGLGQIHLVNAHLRAFGLPDYKFPAGGWLEGFGDIRPPNKHYAVLNVTGRYEDRFHSWFWEVQQLKRMVDASNVWFLGTHREYLEMNYVLSYWPTNDLLDATYVIAKARYFSGCQSALLAIRQALGLPYRMAQSPNHRDCNQYSPLETIINPRSRKLHLFLTTIKKVILR